MTLPTIDQARSWRGLVLVATDDEPVGEIEAIYVDRTTRRPEWCFASLRAARPVPRTWRLTHFFLPVNGSRPA
jgi:hypothetical protein